jgi:hypothetical protein
MFDLLDDRYDNFLPTILISNLPGIDEPDKRKIPGHSLRMEKLPRSCGNCHQDETGTGGIKMKRKTINAVITQKFNEWLESIGDEEVKKLVKKNTVITGGCIASMINSEKVSDFDVYFTNRETVMAVAGYYIGKFREAKPMGPNIKLYTSDDFSNPDSELNQEVARNRTFAEISDEGRDNDLLDFYEMNSPGKEEGRVFIYIKSAGIAAEKPIDFDDCENPLDDEIEDTEDKTKPKYRPVFFSSNAITLSDKIQIVTRFYGNAGQIHSNFDYVHATNSSLI